MTTPISSPNLRRWRSRAFIQPLLVTVVGVATSVVLYLAVTRSANGPLDGPCSYGPDACGYALMGGLGQAVALLPVLLIGLLMTGLHPVLPRLASASSRWP